MMLTRCRLNVQACHTPKKPDTPVVTARKAFEKKRMVSLKDNINKLVAIANADTKEVTDFLKELDQLHKKELMPASSDTRSNDSDADSDENIFIKESS